MEVIDTIEKFEEAYRIRDLKSKKITIPIDIPFSTEALYEKGHRSGSIEFNDCEFTETFTINDFEERSSGKIIWIDTVECSNCVFLNKLESENRSINAKLRFKSCKFQEEVIFKNTSFLQLADFWQSEFFKKTIFYKVDFFGNTVFSGVTFHQNVLFTYTLIDKYIFFRGTKFKKGLDLSLAILSGELNIFDTSLNNYSSLNKPLNEDEYEHAVSEQGKIPLKNKRETFRLLRRIYESNSDFIHSLHFKSLELSAYDHILENKIKTRNNVWPSKFNRFILWLNRKSNKYGTEFQLGILFTFIVGLIFFIPSYLATENIKFSLFPSDWKYQFFINFWVNYLKFLNPTHSINYLGINNGFWFHFFDYLGRIFVGYGIYQTIQAYRKFR